MLLFEHEKGLQSDKAQGVEAPHRWGSSVQNRVSYSHGEL